MINRKVKIIPKSETREVLKNKSQVESKNKLNVAAYCRVSTENEEQQTSYQGQVEYYTEYINNNEKWNLVSIFADEGISGLSRKNRKEFNKMMELCKAKKIDLIITKSISRFGRNTVDVLSCVRELKAQNIGVYFEKENIHTLESSGEILLTILSSLAQEESRSISTNIRWAMKHKFENGELMLNYNNFLGYTKDKNGNLIIVEEEAKIVKEIYGLYLEGQSLRGIARYLEEQGIKTVRGNKSWNKSVIKGILTNEKYMGDALLQKTYTKDYMDKNRKKNKGEIDSYYVENNHKGIISKGTFYKVQEEMARRSSLKNKDTSKSKYSKYVLSEILRCSKCGEKYRRTTWSKNGEKKIVWRCKNRLTKSDIVCNESETIREEDVHNLVLKGLNKLMEEKNIIEEIKKDIQKEMDKPNVKEIDEEIQKLEEEMMNMLENNISVEENEEKYEQLASKIKSLKSEKMSVIKIEDKSGIELEELNMEKFEDEIIRKLIENIKVIASNEIEMQMSSGERIGIKI